MDDFPIALDSAVSGESFHHQKLGVGMDERDRDLRRRDLIKKAAVGGGIVWASPVIQSMATAASAAGTPGPGTTTSTTQGTTTTSTSTTLPVSTCLPGQTSCNEESPTEFPCTDNPQCFCVGTAEGGAEGDTFCACFDRGGCDGYQLCSSSSECLPGEFCTNPTEADCCGGICVPPCDPDTCGGGSAQRVRVFGPPIAVG